MRLNCCYAQRSPSATSTTTAWIPISSLKPLQHGIYGEYEPTQHGKLSPGHVKSAQYVGVQPPILPTWSLLAPCRFTPFTVYSKYGLQSSRNRNSLVFNSSRHAINPYSNGISASTVESSCFDTTGLRQTRRKRYVKRHTFPL